MSDMKDVRARIARIDVTQGQVADAAEMERSAFSRILSGDRLPPAGFFEKMDRILDALEAANEAAEEARRKVMAREGLAS